MNTVVVCHNFHIISLHFALFNMEYITVTSIFVNFYYYSLCCIYVYMSYLF